MLLIWTQHNKTYSSTWACQCFRTFQTASMGLSWPMVRHPQARPTQCRAIRWAISKQRVQCLEQYIFPNLEKIQNLFWAIEKSSQSIEFKLKISIFELYMQKIRDLLDVSKSDLKIRQNKAGCYVENLTEVYVGDRQEISRLIHLGQKNRITCATNMNEHSSRSHMIFLLSLNQFNIQDSSSKTSKLFLIDLAGSQKVGKTGAQGKVLQQAKKINLSLTNLGKVIKHLAQKSNHVPYRDSKLTRVLKDSLGGNSKTTLIVTCSPHEIHLPQTISTLRFGENAQKIKNKPKINRQLTVQELQKIVEKMEGEMKIRDLKIELLEKHIREKFGGELPDYGEVLTYLKVKEDLEEKVEKMRISSQDNSKKPPSQKPQTPQTLTQQPQSPQSNPSLQPLPTSLTQQLQSYYTSRITQMQQQLSNIKATLNKQSQKYYQLKKQYTELHENLTSIMKENIELQQVKGVLERERGEVEQHVSQLEYQLAVKESALQQLQSEIHMQQHGSDKPQPTTTLHNNSGSQSTQQPSIYQAQLQTQLIHNNSPLIKMILGEIFSIIGPYQQQQVLKIIQHDHWYKKVVQDGLNCVDFYQYQKEKINQQIQEFIRHKQMVERQQQEGRQKDGRGDERYSGLVERFERERQRQNEKIITLENKLDKLFDQYHQMISLQTSWKAQCQLYERKLKKKQQKIQQLQETLQQLSQQIEFLQGNNYDDYEDSRSVKSRIVKPLKGGFFFK